MTSGRDSDVVNSQGTFADVVGSARELLLFAMTPPRASLPPERAAAVGQATLERLEAIDVDGLILYDLDDESDRNDTDRPFPYLETIDAVDFRNGPLQDWDGHTVIYRCVGKYDEDEVRAFLASREAGETTVFVGASSQDKPVRTSLPQATEIAGDYPHVMLGGVAIPERHARAGNEHERLLRKQRGGCGMFVTQVVYDIAEAKDMTSDYFYSCLDAGVEPARIVFTLSVCGSEKTLEFLQWLGVDVPRWVQNELRHSHDTLDVSYQHCLAAARELTSFCRYLGLPFGFNIESVSTRRVEIEATVRLAQAVGDLLNRHDIPARDVDGVDVPETAFSGTA